MSVCPRFSFSHLFKYYSLIPLWCPKSLVVGDKTYPPSQFYSGYIPFKRSKNIRNKPILVNPLLYITKKLLVISSQRNIFQNFHQY